MLFLKTLLETIKNDIIATEIIYKGYPTVEFYSRKTKKKSYAMIVTENSAVAEFTDDLGNTMTYYDKRMPVKSIDKQHRKRGLYIEIFEWCIDIVVD
jgi:hypothetical protein